MPSDTLLDAAIRVFARYGIRKTTMADIAGEAGVSRQTLYGRFGDKDGILTAAIDYLTAQVCDRVREGWQGSPDLSSRLWVYFDHAVIDIWKMMQQSPDAADLTTDANPVARPAMAAADSRKVALLAELFAPYVDRMGDQSPEDLARFAGRTLAALKCVPTEAELMAGLVTLDRLLISFLEPPGGTAGA